MNNTSRSTYIWLIVTIAGFRCTAAWTTPPPASSSSQQPVSASIAEAPLLLWQVSRRNVFTVATSALVVSASTPMSASAITGVNVGEAVRKSASNMPGYGPSDVYYPPAWAGLFTIRRQVTRDTGTDLTLTYKFRLLPTIDVNNQAAAVQDRGYNQANLEAALRGAVIDDNDGSSLAGTAVRSYTWSANNPNDVSVELADNSVKSIKVTKRAADSTAETVSSSEFQRVSQVSAATGIPVVTARRVLTKYKAATPIDNQNDAVTTIEGLEIVYDMGGGGDPMSATTATALSTDKPRVLSKSRLLLERLTLSAEPATTVL